MITPAFSLLLAALLAPHAPAPPDGPILARVELGAPSASSFLLRATIPVPAGALDGPLVPFGLRRAGREGAATVAQIEVVTRRADGTPEVIEVLAPMALEEEDRVGDRLRFELVARASGAPPARRSDGLDALLDAAQGGRLVLRMSDVYGHRYRCDLLAAVGEGGVGSRRTAADGAYLRRWRVGGVLLPEERNEGSSSPGGPPLPHMMGVHAYLTRRRNDGVLSLDLRLHNGSSAGRRDPLPGEEPVGTLYWREIELLVPAGWSVLPEVRDPFFGEARAGDGGLIFPLVAAHATKALHMMPPQGQLLRRLVLVAKGDEAAGRRRLAHEGLAFCTHDARAWSWASPTTQAYFPQRDLVGSMDWFRRGSDRGKAALRRAEDVRLVQLLRQLEEGAEGASPGRSPSLGWAHPLFRSQEGAHGGEGIHFIEGHRAIGGASGSSYRLLELHHRMNASRQAEALYDRRGDPVGYGEWADDQGALDFDFRTYGRTVPPEFRQHCRGGPAPREQVLRVLADDLRPPYDRGDGHVQGGKLPTGDDDLVHWMCHDTQHLVRYTKQTKALQWLGNDPLARDDLRLGAELFHLWFHEGASPHPKGRAITLRHLEALAAAHPHQGLPIHRGHAWGIDAFCAAWAAADDAWRERHRLWIERVADLLVAGANPGGIVIRSDSPPLLKNPRYEGAHAFQSEILLLAVRSLIESVFRGVDPERTAALEDLYLRGSDYLFFGPVFGKLAATWSNPQDPVWFHGPRWAFAVARADGYRTPPFSDTGFWGPDYFPEDGFRGDSVETTYGFAILALAADLSPSEGRGLENRYLRRSLDLWKPQSEWPARLRSLTERFGEESFDNSPNCIGYLGRLQNAGVLKAQSSSAR
ncbi:MAG: hypothetical protein CMJ84_08750 [Planctomycetes bacterium]|jgi:hypothetical protein|nr:hypothetical protein [Planctomycetota bacterium]MDP6410687.1 hypothetical protein [Planctomycetota bacterium]